MAQFKSKTIVDAVQWRGDNFDEMKLFLSNILRYYKNVEFSINHRGEFIIETPTNQRAISKGHWIVVGSEPRSFGYIFPPYQVLTNRDFCERFQE